MQPLLIALGCSQCSCAAGHQGHGLEPPWNIQMSPLHGPTQTCQSSPMRCVPGNPVPVPAPAAPPAAAAAICSLEVIVSPLPLTLPAALPVPVFVFAARPATNGSSSSSRKHASSRVLVSLDRRNVALSTHGAMLMAGTLCSDECLEFAEICTSSCWMHLQYMLSELLLPPSGSCRYGVLWCCWWSVDGLRGGAPTCGCAPCCGPCAPSCPRCHAGCCGPSSSLCLSAVPADQVLLLALPPRLRQAVPRLF